METELKHEFVKQDNKRSDLDARICGEIDGMDYRRLELSVKLSERINQLEERIRDLESGTTRWISLS